MFPNGLKNVVIQHPAYWTMIAAAFLMIGCEDVIQVELNSTEPKLVIEGYLSNNPNNCLFYISRTTDFYEPNVVEGVPGATVIISDDAGGADTLREFDPSPGEYFFTRRPIIVPGRTYKATVLVGNATYTASTTMPDIVPIDSLRFEYQPGGGIGSEEDEGYRLHTYFQDQVDRPDYLRFQISKIIGSSAYGYYEYYLYDGRFSDGNVIDYDYFLNVFQAGEKVLVEMCSMDKTMYYYFLTLSEVAATEEGNSFDATPANPNTNWSGGALGYFGAFNSDVKTATVQQ